MAQILLKIKASLEPRDPGSPKTWRRTWLQALGIGVAVTSFQIGLACFLSPEPGFGRSYERLCTWDCAWYASIAAEGYHSTIPPVAQSAAEANVAFFPLYPMLARVLFLGGGVAPHIALLIVAQVFSILFWAALWVLLRRWGISTLASALALLVVLAHPASFFLISGYSESLFLCTLLLYVIYSERRSPIFVASFSGAMMSATRLVGVPAAAFPVFTELVRAVSAGRLPPRATAARAMGVCFLACGGALLFFMYCQLRFGRFDLYFETQRIGWGIVPDYSALWKWKEMHFSFPIDRQFTVGTGLAFALACVIEAGVALNRGRGSGLRRRIPVYLAAFVIFAVTLSGLKSVHFRSMVRYSLAWYLLLLLCMAHLLSRLPRGFRWWRAVLFVSLLLGSLASLVWVQVPHLRDYLRGIWFA